MDFMPGAVSGRIVSTLTAGMLVLAACGPASQPAPPRPHGRRAAPTAPGAATAKLPGEPSTGRARFGAQACPVPGPTIAPAAGAAAAGQPKPGGARHPRRLRRRQDAQPVMVTDVPSDVVTSRIYAALTRRRPQDRRAHAQPGREVRLLRRRQDAELQLRDGLKFSDGSPLTGDDFKFSDRWPRCAARRPTTRTTSTRSSARKEYIDGTADDLSGIKVDGKNITVHAGQLVLPGAEPDRQPEHHPEERLRQVPRSEGRQQEPRRRAREQRAARRQRCLQLQGVGARTTTSR